jgi:hypothetical protein
MVDDLQDNDSGRQATPGPASQVIVTHGQTGLAGRLHGGSKWGHLFCGPRGAPPREMETVLHLNAICLPDGSIAEVGDSEEGGEVFAETAFPLRAGAGVTLGQFLAGALPGIMAQRASWPSGRLACAAPTPQQRDILRRLGLLDGYVALAQPVRFRLVVGQAGTPPRPAPANPAMLAMLEQLRAAGGHAARRIAILPNREREALTLRNRASLTAWLRARRITVIDPEKMPFEATAAALAEASLLILADAAQAGLVGLCHAYTKVLEIAPEGFVGMTAREICHAQSIDWSLVLGSAPSYPLLQPLAFGARVPLSYEIPINVLHTALTALDL